MAFGNFLFEFPVLVKPKQKKITVLLFKESDDYWIQLFGGSVMLDNFSPKIFFGDRSFFRRPPCAMGTEEAAQENYTLFVHNMEPILHYQKGSHSN